MVLIDNGRGNQCPKTASTSFWFISVCTDAPKPKWKQHIQGDHTVRSSCKRQRAMTPGANPSMALTVLKLLTLGIHYLCLRLHQLCYLRVDARGQAIEEGNLTWKEQTPAWIGSHKYLNQGRPSNATDLVSILRSRVCRTWKAWFVRTQPHRRNDFFGWTPHFWWIVELWSTSSSL